MSTLLKKEVITKEDINNYGIFYTPNNLVNNILDLIPIEYFSNPNLKWLDIGAGNGIFSINLYNRLLINLKNRFPNEMERKKHIIKNMLYLIENHPLHIKNLEKMFNNICKIKANIIDNDFLSYNNEFYFDFIIGNPPYNINGKLKTPTNNSLKKSDDGKQIYVDFIKKSITILKPNGYLNLIIPSLWLKPDKAGLYNILTSKKILKLHCLSTNETQKFFNYKAQTPTCYFLIQNTNNFNKPNNIQIYDTINNCYINYNLKHNSPIPTCGISIINKLQKYISSYGNLKVEKTNTPSKKSEFSDIYSDYFKHINIKTTILSKNTPQLVYNYSNIVQPYYDKIKLILSHKMYGFPYLDICNNYGISSRDNYIISNTNYNISELIIIQHFLSTKTAIYIFSTTNYRMRYLERYAFEFIPDISKIKEFSKLPNLKLEEKELFIQNFFHLNNIEKKYINKIKDYTFFI